MMMTSLDTLDIDIGGGITSNPAVLFGANPMNPAINTSMTLASNATSNSDEYTRCARCGYGGCDVRFLACGCAFHA